MAYLRIIVVFPLKTYTINIIDNQIITIMWILKLHLYSSEHLQLTRSFYFNQPYINDIRIPRNMTSLDFIPASIPIQHMYFVCNIIQ